MRLHLWSSAVSGYAGNYLLADPLRFSGALPKLHASADTVQFGEKRKTYNQLKEEAYQNGDPKLTDAERMATKRSTVKANRQATSREIGAAVEEYLEFKNDGIV